MTVHFPNFGKFLKRKASDIEEMEPPASPEQLAAAEAALGVRLPEAFARLLRCTGGLWIRNLDLRSHNRFVHKDPSGRQLLTEGMLCFGEFGLEADGDQVLFDIRLPYGEDPPVFYYAHEGSPPAVRQLAPSFTDWIESLPRSPVFR